MYLCNRASFWQWHGDHHVDTGTTAVMTGRSANLIQASGFHKSSSLSFHMILGKLRIIYHTYEVVTVGQKTGVWVLTSKHILHQLWYKFTNKMAAMHASINHTPSTWWILNKTKTTSGNEKSHQMHSDVLILLHVSTACWCEVCQAGPDPWECWAARG